MEKIMITGAGGFIGTHLTKYFLERGYDVLALPKEQLDVRDFEKCCEMIKNYEPHILVHAAAKSKVTDSFSEPILSLTTNINGTYNILEACRLFAPNAKIIICGSAAEYGNSNGLLTESSPLNPVSPYGVTKVAQENLGKMYASCYGMHVVILRLFNQSGKGKKGDFISDLIHEIKFNPSKEIRLGCMDNYRDFTDIDDTVVAFDKAIKYGRKGEVYNICTGIVNKINDIFEFIVKISNTSKTFYLNCKEKLRPSDERIISGSNEKAQRELQWSPIYDWKKAATDLWNQ